MKYNKEEKIKRLTGNMKEKIEAPVHISYISALKVQKQTYIAVIFILLVYVVTREVFFRSEYNRLNTLIDKKEIILAPGITQFTTAYKNKINDEYVRDATKHFLTLLGTVSGSNIKSNYNMVKGYMSESLRARFDVETATLVNDFETQPVVEIASFSDNDINVVESSRKVKNGYLTQYEVIAHVKIQRLFGGQELTPREEIIQMKYDVVLRSVHESQKWFLRINKLTRDAAENYNLRKRVSEKEG